MTPICRVGYCEKCFKANRPQPGKPFLVFGDTSQSFIVKFARGRTCTRGFTPHFYVKLKVSADNQRIYYKQLCGMCGCGTVYSEDDETDEVQVDTLDSEWSPILMMPTTRWNALILYKDSSLMI